MPGGRCSRTTGPGIRASSPIFTSKRFSLRARSFFRDACAGDSEPSGDSRPRTSGLGVCFLLHSAMATTSRPAASKSKPAQPATSGGGLSRFRQSGDRENGARRVREDVVLTFDDVLLSPRHSVVHPKDVSTKSRFTRNITLNIPFASAAMDTVTESEMAMAMARAGGIGVIHKNMSIDRQAAEVDRVKRSESGMILNPITLSPDGTLREAV